MRQRNAKAGPPPPLQIGKPFPDDRAILWAPVEGLTRAMELSQPAIVITQGALREVIRHLSSSPEQELLGFLIGEPCECPKTQRRYLCVTGTLRTGHAIAEDEPVQIPDAEWLGQQLEVRRRRSTLIGWYHSTPFLSPSPASLDLESHRARFTDPWQCGLVIATEGNEPAGGFFRAQPDAADGGAYVPFYEQVEEEGVLEGGRFRTLIDWKSYSTSELVEHDENERSVHTSGLVRRADAEEGPNALPLMIPQPSLDIEPSTAMRSRWVGIGIMTAIALAITFVAVQIWDSRQLPEPPMAALPHDLTGAGRAAALAAQQRTDSIALANSAYTQAPLGATSSRDSLARGATPAAPSAPAAAPTIAPTAAPVALPAAPGAPDVAPDLRVGAFDSLADSLEHTLANYRTRRADFEAKRLSCTELSHGYRAADEAQVSLAKIARDARALDDARRTRYRALTAGMDTVNDDFDSSKCKRL